MTPGEGQWGIWGGDTLALHTLCALHLHRVRVRARPMETRKQEQAGGLLREPRRDLELQDAEDLANVRDG